MGSEPQHRVQYRMHSVAPENCWSRRDGVERGRALIPSTLPSRWNIKKTYEGVLEDLEGDIICIQGTSRNPTTCSSHLTIYSSPETKITRAQLDKTLACPINFDAFFSFFQDGGPRGIHGTAIFTKRKTCIPVKAEEGIGAALVPAALTTTERIGGYPEEADVDLSFAEMKQLDVEGRTTVCDFGLFVLINL